MKFSLYTGLLLVSLISCSETTISEPDEDPFEASYSMKELSTDSGYVGPVAVGVIENRQIDEASGLAVSRSFKDHLWTHNDSVDHNRIFLIGPDGSDAGTFRIRNTGNRDWEDMSIGPGPETGINYLYVADIGDNDMKYDVKTIYRFREPDLIDPEVTIQWVEGEDVIRFRYPDGKKDAETVMIDPRTKDIYVVSKSDFPTVVYVAPYPQNTQDVFDIEILGTLPFVGATAGDISSDGKNIAIKTKERVYNWIRNDNETVRSALMRPPVLLPYLPEVQGEAIAWTKTGESYFTLSESKGIIPVLYRYDKKTDKRFSIGKEGRMKLL